MASAKKKLDEYHLKILRQLVNLPSNKQCFDCNQRGPTYVDVTIGSFVCTSCSGMLRGLTPPHRVKSISMATFTPEEVDFVKARGNEYCRKLWLGLLDTQPPTKDEQQIKDFMVAKYEEKRFYLDSSVINNAVNGNSLSSSKPSTPNELTKSLPVLPTVKSILHHPTTLVLKAPPAQNKNTNNEFTPEPFADFSKLSIPPPCDPFNSSQSATVPTQPSFANFDNNPVFNNSCSSASLDLWTDISTLTSPFFKVPMRPLSGRSSCPPTNRWSMPGVGEAGTVPGEDRYAALKDLDCLMKSQQKQQQPQAVEQPPPEWGSGVSNGMNNVWSVPSLFSTSPQSQDSVTSNPFKGGATWNNVDNISANPFRSTGPEGLWSNINNSQITNGFTTSQSLNFPTPKVQSNEAISNPFVIGPSPQVTSHHSSNPFL